MNIHCVGLGGIGLSGLAQLLVEQGHSVQGSNALKTEGVSIAERAQIPVFIGHDANYITSETDLLIYSEAVPVSNPERSRAAELGIQQKSYFQVLGELTHDFRTIAVVGTHGKTTTVGLLAAGAMASDLDPWVLMGAANRILSGGNFHKGAAVPMPLLIVEACEYRENFQWIEPEMVLITDVELDHTDYYRDLDHYLSAMKRLVHRAKVIICHPQARNISSLLEGYTGVICSTELAPEVSLSLTGTHNRENAALAAVALKHLGADLERAQKGLSAYTGGSRRQQYLGLKNNIHVYDDYGHHPTEIVATIQSIREKHPNARLGLIFEPHQHKRTKSFFSAFLESFKAADAVGLHPIYAARDTEADKRFTRQAFLEADASLVDIATQQAAHSFASTFLEKDDVLLFMGAGVIDIFAKTFMESN